MKAETLKLVRELIAEAKGVPQTALIDLNTGCTFDYGEGLAKLADRVEIALSIDESVDAVERTG
jgi:hypothetical protein